jgi:hypothetical protein
VGAAFCPAFFEETVELAQKIALSGRPITRVKGIKRLFLIPLSDGVKDRVPETMPLVWIGVVKQVVKLWMTKKTLSITLEENGEK